VSGDGRRAEEEVLAAVPEHERFRRLEELEEEQEPITAPAPPVSEPEG
jgi:hypothetical protein